VEWIRRDRLSICISKFRGKNSPKSRRVFSQKKLAWRVFVIYWFLKAHMILRPEIFRRIFLKIEKRLLKIMSAIGFKLFTICKIRKQDESNALEPRILCRTFCANFLQSFSDRIGKNLISEKNTKAQNTLIERLPSMMTKNA